MIARLCFRLTLAVALLAGCSAPSPSSDVPGAETAPVASAPTAAPAPQPALATTPTPASGTDSSAPAPPSREPPRGAPPTAFDPANPDRACRTDSDCAVKDVGNCCGAFPMCVNKDAKTDPAAVRAQCEKDGMASICGFQEVAGCQCVQGRCENQPGGEVAM